MKAFADHEEATAGFLPSCIVSVYDVVESGADFGSLRYVMDARKPPLGFTCAEFYRNRWRQKLPPILTWHLQHSRAEARDFTRQVFS